MPTPTRDSSRAPAIVATLPDGVDVAPGTVVSVRLEQTDVDAGTVSFALV